jgi:transcription antitermination factor NusG
VAFSQLSSDVGVDPSSNPQSESTGARSGVVASGVLIKPRRLSPPQSHWYALSLRSRCEKKAHAELLQRGIESFLPLIEEVHRWSDRKKKVMEPLFRGYLFVRTDLKDRTAILQTAGVVRFVGIGARLSWIPDAQIESVRTVAGEAGRIKRESYLSSGERVKVISGPFEGVEGIIVRMKGSTRVVVSLDTIVQSVSIEVTPESVKLNRDRERVLKSRL